MCVCALRDRTGPDQTKKTPQQQTPSHLTHTNNTAQSQNQSHLTHKNEKKTPHLHTHTHNQQTPQKQVQEFFGDYMAINPDLFSLQLPDPLLLSVARCIADFGLFYLIHGMQNRSPTPNTPPPHTHTTDQNPTPTPQAGRTTAPPTSTTPHPPTTTTTHPKQAGQQHRPARRRGAAALRLGRALRPPLLQAPPLPDPIPGGLARGKAGTFGVCLGLGRVGRKKEKEDEDENKTASLSHTHTLPPHRTSQPPPTKTASPSHTLTPPPQNTHTHPAPNRWRPPWPRRCRPTRSSTSATAPCSSSLPGPGPATARRAPPSSCWTGGTTPSRRCESLHSRVSPSLSVSSSFYLSILLYACDSLSLRLSLELVFHI